MIWVHGLVLVTAVVVGLGAGVLLALLAWGLLNMLILARRTQ